MFNVLYSADDNYWMHLYVSLYSLLKNNLTSNFTVYILTDKINEDFVDNLSFLYQMGNLKDCKIIKMSTLVAAAYPLGYHFTKAIYYNLFIGQVLPEKVRKVLKLDCDTIISGSLDELFNIDLEEYVLGAAPDYHLNALYNLERLNLSKDTKYFNAGVLLINMEKWRSMNIESKVLAYIEKNSNVIEFADQDALNTVLHYDYKELSPKFNYMEEPEASQLTAQPEISPAIIHYSGICKPWFYMSEHYLKERYWAYLQETPYRGYREEDRNLKNILIKMVRYLKRRLIELLIGLTKKIPILYGFLRRIYRLMQNKNAGNGAT